MIKVSPSILASDFSKLGDEIKRIEEGGAVYAHIDVMDGQFVPNISIGPCIIQSVRPHSKIVFDTHLMIVNPGKYVPDFAKAGADIITIHYESCEDQIEVLKQIRALGKKAGISIKPATPAFVLEPLLEYVDLILIMTVEPGFGGQSFIPETMASLRDVYAMVKKSGYDIDIEVDGGINDKNAEIAAENGANVFVAGSAVFKNPNVAEAISGILESARRGEAKRLENENN
ncbi:MAG: ribulose-phosphate 3-epimerase [Clostridia bacterium]|nr:ribulose-phosphate 3-epimerase [Clostridia bacterium]